MLRLKGIWTRYGPIDVLKGIDLEVNKGELVCLLGGNACGKTTTMKTIIGLVKPYKGEIEFDGLDIARSRPLPNRASGNIARSRGEENLSLSHRS